MSDTEQRETYVLMHASGWGDYRPGGERKEMSVSEVLAANAVYRQFNFDCFWKREAEVKRAR
jgi:hypothetical protein